MTQPGAHSWQAAELGLRLGLPDSNSHTLLCIRLILLFTLFCGIFFMLVIYFFLTLLSFFSPFGGTCFQSETL